MIEMKKQLIFLIFVALGGMCCLPSIAQKQSYFQHFTSHDGLPNNNIYDIIQDSKGFIWFSTANGISRFDGYTYKNIRTVKTAKDTFKISIVRSMCEDKNNNLWICTEKDGLIKYNRDHNSFENYNTENSPLQSNKVYKILHDRQNRYWIATAKGINMFEYLNDSVIWHGKNLLKEFPDFIEGKGIKGLYEDSDGIVWIAGYANVAISYEWDKDKYEIVDILDFNLYNSNFGGINVVEESNDGKIWFGFWHGGFRCYDKKKKDFSECNEIAKVLGVDAETVTDISIDGNVMFLSTWMNGLYRVNIEEKTVNNWRHVLSAPYGLRKNELRTIEQDRNGNIWIGTSADAGANMLSKQSLFFNSYTLAVNDENIDVSAHAFEIDSDGNLYTGTKSGVFVQKNLDSEVKRIEIDSKYSNELMTSILSLEFDSIRQNLWIGTEGNGLFCYNVKNKGVKKYSSNLLEGRSRIGNNVVFELLIDNDVLWIGSWGVGLHKLDLLTDSVSQIQLLENNYPSNVVTDIISENDSILWVTTYGRGLQRINKETGIAQVFFGESTGEYVGKGFFLQLLKDPRGRIWAGTLNNGLIVFDYKTKDFSVVGNEENVEVQVGSAIEIDNEGRIWVGTNDKIVCINPDNYSIKKFGKVYGVVNNSYAAGASIHLPNDDMFFGGNGNTVVFNADRVIEIGESDLKPEITNVIVEDRKDYLSEICKKSPENLDTIVLEYYSNSISIEFSALQFTDPSNVIYRYMLEGFDKKWKLTKADKRVASYTNLPSGDYLLKIQATQAGNKWSDYSKELHISITAPFWERWWFYVVGAILIVIIFVQIVNFRVRQYKRTQVKLEHTVRERTQVILQQNEEIKSQRDAIIKQKDEIEKAHKNTTDSINYAKKIQEAILPSSEQFSNIMPNSFVFYEPRDIVSGDFYWLYKTETKIAIAAGDCTGHGVPGAFLSVLGISLLNDIAKRTHLDNAGTILNLLRQRLIYSLKQRDGINTPRDGMDIALCIIDKEEKKVSFAGAFNPLYLFTPNGELVEYKADKMPIGSYVNKKDSFTEHSIMYEEGTTLYMFSDGYIDQFGGVEGKKLKRKPFKQILELIYKLPIHEQREYLSDMLYARLEPPTGKVFEQIDDILIVGIKL